MHLHDSNGLALWVPFLIIVGLVYIVRYLLNRFRIKKGEKSSIEGAGTGINILTGLIVCILFTIVFVYADMKVPNELRNVFNNSPQAIQWSIIFVGTFVWFSLVGALFNVVWKLGRFLKSKLNHGGKKV